MAKKPEKVAKKPAKPVKATPEKEEPRLGEENSGDRLEQPPSSEGADVAKPVSGDYLRQYQYKKQTAFGSAASDPVPGSKAAKMKEILLAQEVVTMFIPENPGEDASVKATVNLNGYRLDLPKQTYLQLPKQVAETLMVSFKQTREAIDRGKIDG